VRESGEQLYDLLRESRALQRQSHELQRAADDLRERVAKLAEYGPSRSKPRKRPPRA
jgi:hypothetical protein